jgi:steroid delta-isomerase-like uncharacterized protein
MDATTSSATRLDPGFVEEWARRYLDAWNAHDGQAVAAMCTDDVVWYDAALPAPAHGRDEVRAFIDATARSFPDFRVEEIDPPYVSQVEPIALGRYRMTGTMRGPWEAMGLAATGRRMDVLGVDEWTFRGELLSHYRTYYDSFDMARQLGVLPPAGSAAERAMARLQHLQARFQRRRPEVT